MSPRARADRSPAWNLPPNAFAVVMATGIVGTAFATAGFRPIGVLLAIVATVAFAVLVVLLVGRVSVARRAVAADLADPARAFGFFTVVAAVGVLTALAALLGVRWAGVVAAVIATPVWLALSYAMLPWLVRRAARPVAASVDGSWMLAVVAIQALSIIASVLGAGIVSLALWGAGVVVYVLIAGLLAGRLLGTRDDEPATEPTAWVVMGAVAISALAAARLGQLPELHGLRPFLVGAGLVLWGFGTWCVPYLVTAAVWKRLVRRQPLRYEAALWAVVFPLGMYTAATQALATATVSPLLRTVGEVALWVAGVAWLVVAVLGIVDAVRGVRRRAL